MAWEARLGLCAMSRITGSLAQPERNEEKYSWVIQSTWRRKTKGKAAYWKSHRDLTDERGRGWQDPCGMNKARLHEAQLTVVAQRDLWESVWSPDPSLRWSSIPTVALS